MKNIYIPYNIRGRIVNWYHYNLCHPGSSRLQLTLAQTMYWPGMVSDCVNYTKSCDKCQRFKKKRVKYGKLPPKVAEVVPWETLCIDLVGPYTVTLKNNKETTLSAMTFIDPATGWFEIAELGNKSSAHVSHLLDSTWLCRYPHPRTIVFDNGSEFKGDLLVILQDYGIKARPTMVKTPQTNSILERVHQVLGDMLRTKNLAELDFSLEDTWPNILASVAYAIRSTAHTTLGATPAQLVFRRDMVMPLQYIAQWDLIKKSK